MKGPLRVHYDEGGDFLEISAGKPSKCYASEVQPGVFLRKDEKTDEVKSVGIMSFKKRSSKFKDVQLNLPVDINFSVASS